MKDPKKAAQGRRLQQLRKQAGFGIDEAAKRTGVPVDTLKAHEAGKRSLHKNADLYIEKYAVPGASAAWLLTDENAPSWARPNGNHAPSVVVRTVPRLTPTEAVTMPNAFQRLDELATKRATREAIDSGVGPRAFALPIEDDTMRAVPPQLDTPSFNEGDVVIFDPDQTYKVGDFVLAECGSAPLFRQLYDGGELVALNKRYKPTKLKKGSDRIIAKMVRHVKKY